MSNNKKLTQEELDKVVDFARRGSQAITTQEDADKLTELLTRPVNIHTLMAIIKGSYDSVITDHIGQLQDELLIDEALFNISMVSQAKLKAVFSKLHKQGEISDEAFKILNGHSLAVGKREIDQAVEQVRKNKQEAVKRLEKANKLTMGNKDTKEKNTK